MKLYRTPDDHTFASQVVQDRKPPVTGRDILLPPDSDVPFSSCVGIASLIPQFSSRIKTAEFFVFRNNA